MGTILGWTSQAIPSLQEKNDTDPHLVKGVTTQTEAWIGSSMTLGALVGALASDRSVVNWAERYR